MHQDDSHSQPQENQLPTVEEQLVEELQELNVAVEMEVLQKEEVVKEELQNVQVNEETKKDIEQTLVTRNVE